MPKIRWVKTSSLVKYYETLSPYEMEQGFMVLPPATPHAICERS